MTDLYPVTAAVTGVLGLVAGPLVPRLIASVPEPEPEDPEPEPEGEADGTRPSRRSRRSSTPTSRPCRGCAGRPRSPRAVSAAACSGWSWAGVVAARGAAAGAGLGGAGGDRLADPAAAPRLIAPACAVTVVAILLSLAWRLWPGARRPGAGRRSAWLVAVASAFFVLGSSTPAGLGFGDVRLSAACWAWPWATWAGRSGWSGIYGGFLLGAVIGGLLRPAQGRGPQGLPVRPVHARRAPSWASSSDSRSS